jgi:hypothetical protein
MLSPAKSQENILDVAEKGIFDVFCALESSNFYANFGCCTNFGRMSKGADETCCCARKNWIIFPKKVEKRGPYFF